jgi:hypothetical protein
MVVYAELVHKDEKKFFNSSTTEKGASTFLSSDPNFLNYIAFWRLTGFAPWNVW